MTALMARMMLLALAGLALPASAGAAESYRGFTIDDSRVRDQPNLAAHAFLKKLFGPAAGGYAGSLTK